MTGPLRSPPAHGRGRGPVGWGWRPGSGVGKLVLMRPLEVTPAGILASVAVLGVVAACVALGFWQLDRRDQRLALNEAIAHRLEAGPIALDRAPLDTTGLTYRRAVARGVPDGARSVVLAGRSHAGAPGVHLLSPLRMGERALLVNRGWLPAPDAATVDLDAVALEGEVRIEGVLLPFPDVDLEGSGTGDFRRTWYRFDEDGLRAQSPYPLAGLYLQATAPPSGPGVPDSARGFPVILAPPSLDAGPHLSYAVQWFSFAAIFLIGWVALLARRGEGTVGGGSR